MRTIYVILLGLVLFQAVFLVLSDFFPYTAVDDTIEDPTTSDDFTQYNIAEGNILSIVYGFGAGGLIMGVAFAGAFTTKNYSIAGAGLFIGLITGLYISTWSMLTNINITNNTYITGFVVIMGIAIGILATFTVVDMFAPQGALQ